MHDVWITLCISIEKVCDKVIVAKRQLQRGGFEPADNRFMGGNAFVCLKYIMYLYRMALIVPRFMNPAHPNTCNQFVWVETKNIGQGDIEKGT